MADDCDDLLRDIADFLHGELDEQRSADLREHLDDCPPCLESADFQAQLRALIAKRCCEEVPDSFRARVAAMLQVQVQVQDSVGPGVDP
jgi:mycothiol system anti-sigma-R factor